MKKIVYLLFASILVSYSFESNSVIITDIFTSADNSYILEYKAKDFLKSSLPQQTLDPESFDEDLLIATLYFTLEAKRPKRKTEPLRPKKQLDKASTALLNKLSKNRIKHAMGKRKVPKKKWEKIVKNAGFKGRFVAMAASTVPLYDYPKRFKVKYQQLEDSPDFSYLERKILKPVDLHTYLSLAEKLIKKATHSKKRKLLKSKGLSAWGCAIRIDQKDEKRLPYLTMVMLGGGYRLALLED